MMRRFIITVLIGFLAAAVPQGAGAQESGVTLESDKKIMPVTRVLPRKEPKEPRRYVPPEATNDYVSLPQYNTMVYRALTRPKDFDFTALRSYYTLVPQYDPLGDTARREMLDLAFKIQNDPDTNVRKDAFDKYGALVMSHLASIDVVAQALVLSREDKIFGDPTFYQYMQRGLMRSIMESGDGRSLMGAYDAMTLGEETALLAALRVKVLKSEPRESGGVYYNMHEVQSNDSHDPYWIFVDVSKPMVVLERKRQDKSTVFAIPAQ